MFSPAFPRSNDNSLAKHFVLADYLNKPGSIFFNNGFEQMRDIASLISNSKYYNVESYQISLLRIQLLPRISPTIDYKHKFACFNDNKVKINEATVSYGDSLDLEGLIRKSTYRKIGIYLRSL